MADDDNEKKPWERDYGTATEEEQAPWEKDYGGRTAPASVATEANLPGSTPRLRAAAGKTFQAPTRLEKETPKIPENYGFTPGNVLGSVAGGIKGVIGSTAEGLYDTILGEGKDASGQEQHGLGGLIGLNAKGEFDPVGRLEWLGQKYIADPAAAEAKRAGKLEDLSRQEEASGGTLSSLGHASEAVGHRIAAGVPLVGPWAAHLGERAGAGDIGGAGGEMAGAFAGGKMLEHPVETAKMPLKVADKVLRGTPLTEAGRLAAAEKQIQTVKPPRMSEPEYAQKVSNTIPDMQRIAQDNRGKIKNPEDASDAITKRIGQMESPISTQLQTQPTTPVPVNDVVASADRHIDTAFQQNPSHFSDKEKVAARQEVLDLIGNNPDMSLFEMERVRRRLDSEASAYYRSKPADQRLIAKSEATAVTQRATANAMRDMLYGDAANPGLLEQAGIQAVDVDGRPVPIRDFRKRVGDLISVRDHFEDAITDAQKKGNWSAFQVAKSGPSLAAGGAGAVVGGFAHTIPGALFGLLLGEGAKIWTDYLRSKNPNLNTIKAFRNLADTSRPNTYDIQTTPLRAPAPAAAAAQLPAPAVPMPGPVPVGGSPGFQNNRWVTPAGALPPPAPITPRFVREIPAQKPLGRVGAPQLPAPSAPPETNIPPIVEPQFAREEVQPLGTAGERAPESQLGTVGRQGIRTTPAAELPKATPFRAIQEKIDRLKLEEADLRRAGNKGAANAKRVAWQKLEEQVPEGFEETPPQKNLGTVGGPGREGILGKVNKETELPKKKVNAEEEGIPFKMVKPKEEPGFRSAVENTPGAKLNKDGSVTLDLSRRQLAEQAGERSIRSGVFFTPEANSPFARHYTGKGGYGGPVKIVEKQITLKDPLVVKAATGGKLPERVFDHLKGNGAYQSMRNDVLRSTGILSFKPVAYLEEAVGDVLEKYGADRDYAYDIVRHSKTGNTLPYAIQEHIVAQAIRDAGYESALGYSKHQGAPRLSEVFDAKRENYPGGEEGIPYTKPMPIPTSALRGGPGNIDLNTTNILHHELAHAIVGSLDGFEHNGIVSHRSQYGERGMGAATLFKIKQFRDYTGAFRKDVLLEKGDKLADLFAAGAAINEILDEIPRDKNPGLYGDRQMARELFDAYGFPKEEHERLFNAAIDRAKEKLSKPGISDLIRDEATRREDNLPVEYHFSKNRVDHIINKVRSLGNEAVKSDTGNAPAGVEGSDRGGQETVAGGEGAGAGKSSSETPREKLKPFKAPKTTYNFEIKVQDKPGVPFSEPRTISIQAFDRKKAFKEIMDRKYLPEGVPRYAAEYRLVGEDVPEIGPPSKVEPVKAQSKEGFEHISPKLLEHLEPDELDFIKGNKRAQQNIQESFDNIKPTFKQTKAAIEAGSALAGWWRRFIDTFDELGKPAEGAKIEKLGPEHAEALKAWHSAVSGNKSVADANRTAWGTYADWLDAGRPKDRKTINEIVAANGKPKGNAAISDTLDKNGKILNQGLDTTKLYNLINSPQMRDISPEPFHGKVFDPENPSPVAGVSPGARKIPSMAATVAGKGNLNRLVLDAHMLDFYGENGWTDNKYIAHSAHLRAVAKEMGLTGGEAQEQIWGTVLGLKKLMREGRSPAQAAGELSGETINAIGKDYADIIRDDPELNSIFEQLKKHGIDPGGERAQQRLREITSGKPASQEAGTHKNLLTHVAKRIQGQLAKPEPIQISKPIKGGAAPATQAGKRLAAK